MSFQEKGIAVKQFGGSLIASIRKNRNSRQQITEVLEELLEAIPPEFIVGTPFWIRHFIHSYPEGFDVEVGIPVNAVIVVGRVSTRTLPEYEVLSMVHHGSAEGLSGIYQTLFGTQSDYGLISDEFCIEVLHDRDALQGEIEVLMVLHPWKDLFDHHLDRVMGGVVRDAVMEGGDRIFLESTTSERFAWTKTAVDRLDQVADDFQCYEVLSSCSHVFPREQAEKLRAVYLDAYERKPDVHKAVDAVIAFMKEDPGWRQKVVREGSIVYTTKNPSNPEAYARAETDLEKKQAYCFCPIVSAYIDEGMSPTFCYCSAGFERKQWEVALGKAVRIDIVQSLLKGDSQCQFAIHLPRE